jgi:hypothetical protein
MATIYNSDLSKELVKGASLQQMRDSIPNQLADKVVPTMEVNPNLFRKINVCRSGSAANATTTALYVTPTDKDFYIVAMALSVIKDVTSTSNLSSIQVTIDGITGLSILSLAAQTLTAQTLSSSISLPCPIKIDRGTTISVNNSTNVANIKASATIFGYYIDNSNA